MKFVELKCSGCGAPMLVDREKNRAYCEYCGTTLLIDEDHTEEIRRLKEKLGKLEELERENQKQKNEECKKERLKKAWEAEDFANEKKRKEQEEAYRKLALQEYKENRSWIEKKFDSMYQSSILRVVLFGLVLLSIPFTLGLFILLGSQLLTVSSVVISVVMILSILFFEEIVSLIGISNDEARTFLLIIHCLCWLIGFVAILVLNFSVCWAIIFH